MHAGTFAAGDRLLDRRPAIIGNQAIGLAGSDQTAFDRAAIKLAASDKLKQREGGAVERVVAGARQRGRQRRELGIERGGPIGIGRGERVATTNARPFRNGRPLARQVNEPIRSNGQLVLRIGEPTDIRGRSHAPSRAPRHTRRRL